MNNSTSRPSRITLHHENWLRAAYELTHGPNRYTEEEIEQYEPTEEDIKILETWPEFPGVFDRASWEAFKRTKRFEKLDPVTSERLICLHEEFHSSYPKMTTIFDLKQKQKAMQAVNDNTTTNSTNQDSNIQASNAKDNIPNTNASNSQSTAPQNASNSVLKKTIEITRIFPYLGNDEIWFDVNSWGMLQKIPEFKYLTRERNRRMNYYSDRPLCRTDKITVPLSLLPRCTLAIYPCENDESIYFNKDAWSMYMLTPEYKLSKNGSLPPVERLGNYASIQSVDDHILFARRLPDTHGAAANSQSNEASNLSIGVFGITSNSSQGRFFGSADCQPKQSASLFGNQNNTSGSGLFGSADCRPNQPTGDEQLSCNTVADRPLNPSIQNNYLREFSLATQCPDDPIIGNGLRDSPADNSYSQGQFNTMCDANAVQGSSPESEQPEASTSSQQSQQDEPSVNTRVSDASNAQDAPWQLPKMRIVTMETFRECNSQQSSAAYNIHLVSPIDGESAVNIDYIDISDEECDHSLIIDNEGNVEHAPTPEQISSLQTDPFFRGECFVFNKSIWKAYKMTKEYAVLSEERKDYLERLHNEAQHVSKTLLTSAVRNTSE